MNRLGITRTVTRHPSTHPQAAAAAAPMHRCCDVVSASLGRWATWGGIWRHVLTWHAMAALTWQCIAMGGRELSTGMARVAQLACTAGMYRTHCALGHVRTLVHVRTLGHVRTRIEHEHPVRDFI
eukprot:jgi/Ulvmu1/10861/UM007_0035.1